MANYIPNNQPGMQQQPIGDPIAQLPVDQSQPSNSEIQIINTLFKKNRKTADIIVDEAKDAILVGVLVAIFCIPQVDEQLKKYVPITRNSLPILILIKGMAATFLFWIITHFYLSRAPPQQ